MLVTPNISIFGNGTTDLIYLPGNLQYTENVAPVVDRLAKAFRVHVIEVPGNSRKPLPSNYTFKDIADSLTSYIRPFGRVHLTASSYGTAVALEYAESYPRHIETLSLYGGPRVLPSKSVLGVKNALTYLSTNEEAFAKLYCEMLVSDKVPRYRAVRKACIGAFKRMSNMEREACYQNCLRLLAMRADRQYQITMPTLCFSSEHDSFVTPVSVQDLADSIGAEYRLVTDADHMLHIERPEVFASIIAEHINDGALSRLAA